jgi:hypothetical protein
MPFFDWFRRNQPTTQEIQLVSRSLLGLEHLVFEDGEPSVLEVGDDVVVYRYKVIGNGVTALALTVWDHASTDVVTLLMINLEANYQVNNLVMTLSCLTKYGDHVVDKADVCTLLEYISNNRLLGVQAFALVTALYEPSSRVGDVLLFFQGLGTGRQDSVRMLAFAARAALDSLVNEIKFLNQGGTAVFHSRRSTDLFVNEELIGEDNEDIPMVVDIRRLSNASEFNHTGSRIPASSTIKF